MLTESEKRWVAWKGQIRRDKDRAGAWCQNCPHLGRNAAGCYGEPYCPLFPDMQDALEFSERVAAKLADPYFPPMDKGSTLEFGYFLMPPADRLMWARIAVEEEMDEQSKD